MISAQTLEKLDKAGIACFIKRADGRYSFINQSGAEMLGLKPSEIIDRGDSELPEFHSFGSGFWHPEQIGGGLIGISIADDEPTPEQLKLLELMKVILSEAASEVVAQIELLNTNPTVH